MVKFLGEEDDEWRKLVDEERNRFKELDKNHQGLKGIVARVRKERDEAEERKRRTREGIEASGEVDSLRELLRQGEKEKEGIRELLTNREKE